MSHVGQAYHTGSVPADSLALAIRPTVSSDPGQYVNVRLVNGAAFYTAGGTSVSGGSVLMADQGAPALMSDAWPVKLSDGSGQIGTNASPIIVSGSVFILNPSVGGMNASVTNLTSSASSQLFLGANSARRAVVITNDSPENLYVKFGSVAQLVSYTYRIGPGGTLELPMGSLTPAYLGRIDGVWYAATGSAMITEVTT